MIPNYHRSPRNLSTRAKIYRQFLRFGTEMLAAVFLYFIASSLFFPTHDLDGTRLALLLPFGIVPLIYVHYKKYRLWALILLVLYGLPIFACLWNVLHHYFK
jgi:hypothetical protein